MEDTVQLLYCETLPKAEVSGDSQWYEGTHRYSIHHAL